MNMRCKTKCIEALYKEPVILQCFQGHLHQRKWNLINNIAASINLVDLVLFFVCVRFCVLFLWGFFLGGVLLVGWFCFLGIFLQLKQSYFRR